MFPKPLLFHRLAAAFPTEPPADTRVQAYRYVDCTSRSDLNDRRIIGGCRDV